MSIQLSDEWKTKEAPNDYRLLLLIIDDHPIPILGTYYDGTFVQIKSSKISTSFLPIRGTVVAWRANLGIMTTIPKKNEIHEEY